jgi:hypothetical protein
VPIVLKQFPLAGFVGIVITDPFDLSHGARGVLFLVLSDKKYRLEEKNWVDLELLKISIISTTLLPKSSQIDAVWIESSDEQIEGGQVSPAFIQQANILAW